MSDESKIGDLVKLKSGGPDMTVTMIGDNQFGRKKVFCQWFDKGKLCEAEFEPNCVEPSNTKSDIQVRFISSPPQDAG